MGLGYQVYAAVAAGAAAVLASSPPAAPHSGVQLGSLPFPTNFPNGDHLLLRDMEDIEERQNRSPAQKILMGCPEMFKEPILHCSSCGGESDTPPGKCKDSNGLGWICQCTDQGANGLTTSLVKTIVSGQITTATYELDTSTEYASLRQHIALTTTAAATATSSHDSGIETIAVVVLAGGVAWSLAGRGHNVSHAEGS